MRILVLGGTAFLSAEIVRQGVALGHRVTCLARGTTRIPPDGATWLKADRSLGAEAYAGAARQDWDAVIDVARDPALAKGALAALAGRTAHWTFVSTSSVYADNSVPGAAEDAALLPSLPAGAEATPETYGAAKAAIEAATLAATEGRAHLCRAGLISGPGDSTDRYGYWPGRFARGGSPVLVPAIAAHPTQIIDARDLAAWLLQAAEQGTTGTLNAIGDAVPFGSYIEASRAAAGHRGGTVEANVEFLAAEGVAYWAGPDSLPLWLPPGNDGFMARSNTAAKAAGLTLRPWQETVEDTLLDERHRGLDRPRKAGLSPATEARLVGALTNGP
ncbi:epimerase [Arthrobacter sp. ZBG10]|uniref:epimerase n=1 Tax=unclassified Arthrobacter TaxID=235627 RepID=UPI000682C20B|nr:MULTISPECIES: epimerase [unclassified Arthrobacter]KNH18810.1 epimerase [Arthrobacter sp. ZBG10]KQR02517.1 epimerase [Arthrobacter sp. Leaf141]